jgi:hypothetical protein
MSHLHKNNLSDLAQAMNMKPGGPGGNMCVVMPGGGGGATCVVMPGGGGGLLCVVMPGDA